jgi:UDP-N-acetylmuramoylalanine--D-glutamate ligase
MSITRFELVKTNLSGKKVLVYSMGIEGQDLARWFIRKGSEVTMSDTRTEHQLRAAGANPPKGVSKVSQGQALLDPQGFDIVATSQSILTTNQVIDRANKLKIPVISQMQLALEICQADIIGVTGSSGKSTTTALVGFAASAANITSFTGGNLGGELLKKIEQLQKSAKAFLEISHTQLQYIEKSPHIVGITNITANHLDQFNWEDYVSLKVSILKKQKSSDIAILNKDDITSWNNRNVVQGKTQTISLQGPIAGDGSWVEDKKIFARINGNKESIIDLTEVKLRGSHNLENALMATALACSAQIPKKAIHHALRNFPGLPHRLETIGETKGIKWINDSIATTPERTIAAMVSYTEPIILLLGGRGKNLPLTTLCEQIPKSCKAVICFGETGSAFANELNPIVTTKNVDSLEEAVLAAEKIAVSNDLVLLSPAGNSFDAYPNFEVRGEHYRQLVTQLDDFKPWVTKESNNA